jgi:NADH dehydrogenase/NADH:ubiquinone oxidoreductase subunit G
MIDFIVNISINMAINVIQILFRLNKTIPTLCFLLRFKRDS